MSFRSSAEGVRVVGLEEDRVEGVDPVLLADVELQAGEGRELHAEEGDPIVATRRPRFLRHGLEFVGVPGLDVPEVPAEVLHRAQLPAEGQTLEGVGRHPVVLAVDVALGDLLPVALGHRVFPVPQRGEGLAEDPVAFLSRFQERRAVLVVGRVERRRPVDGGPDLERVEEPAGPVAEPAPEGPGLVLRAVRVLAVHVVTAEVEREVRVTQEGREVLHVLLERREEPLHGRRLRLVLVGLGPGPERAAQPRQERHAHDQDAPRPIPPRTDPRCSADSIVSQISLLCVLEHAWSQASRMPGEKLHRLVESRYLPVRPVAEGWGAGAPPGTRLPEERGSGPHDGFALGRRVRCDRLDGRTPCFPGRAVTPDSPGARSSRSLM